ncbi:MAG: ketopantoate reductase family protein [Deltaproteobacteria bacterium]|nr:ketopantoate reductase family protein [Deltaproteobacteria bacterium]
MRIAVIGTGAVGGYFGARLAAGGQNVAFLARGAHLEALRKDGLLIKSPQGDLRIQSIFSSDPEEIGPADLILFCVKSYDTEAAAKALAPIMTEKTKIVSLQNGVDNPAKLAAQWGENRTLAGVVYIGARLSTPGCVEHSSGGRIVLGQPDGRVSEETASVQRLFSHAQVPCVLTTEIRKFLWSKLVWNAPFCAISCLARATVKEILESDSLTALATSCMEETREAAKCDGIELEPSVIEEAMSLSRSIGDFKPSMLQDLEAGKPLEYEAFNGVICDRLRGAGKKAPVNGVFYALLQFLDERMQGVRPKQRGSVG